MFASLEVASKDIPKPSEDFLKLCNLNDSSSVEFRIDICQINNSGTVVKYLILG